MTITVYPADAVAGAPSYTGRKLRQAVSTLASGATAARPLGGFSGVRPGSGTVGTATSTTWTITPHAGQLDLEAAAEASVYLYAIDANQTGAMTAADANNPRVDIVYLTLNDPAEGDGSTTPGVVPGYLAGSPAATPAAPATPARSMVLFTIAVPKVGGGSPTVTMAALEVGAAGSPVGVRSQAQRDALTAYAGLQCKRLDLAGLIETHDGTGWRGARKTYSPAWTADTLNPNRGTDGSVTGAYTETGEFVDAVIVVKMGTSGVAQGTGSYALSLPVPADLTEPFAFNGAALYTTGGQNYVLIPSPKDATNIRVMVNGDNDPWAPLVPAAITTGAVMRVAVRYRRA